METSWNNLKYNQNSCIAIINLVSSQIKEMRQVMNNTNKHKKK